MKWFKHDSRASHDAKLQRLQMKYGMEGYGLYWYCLEMIASNVEPDNLTFELEHDSEIIAFRTGIHYERVQEMMAHIVSLGLFEEHNGVITCLKLARRLDDTTSRNPEIRNIKSKLFPESAISPKQLRSDSEESTTRIDQIREDKTRVEEIRSKNISTSQRRFKKPSTIEVKEYCDERNNEIDPQAFCDFYESKGWRVGNSPMKDWKACVRTWEKNQGKFNGGRDEPDFNSTTWS